MRYFVELKNNRVIQIYHCKDQPVYQVGFDYVEIQKEGFPKSWTPPFEGAYLTYTSNGFEWKTDLSYQEISHTQETKAREKRDKLLQETDWTQLPDVSETIKLKFKQYRQSLRDLSTQPKFPVEIAWPEKPL